MTRAAMSYSVVIPCYNEARNIEACIRSLQTDGNLPFIRDIVVVDNGSDDGSIDIVRTLGVVLVENRDGVHHTIARLRNLGARQTTGDVLLFLDGDMLVPSSFLNAASKYFQRDFQGLIGFVETVPSDASWVGRAWGNVSRMGRDRVVEVDFLPGRNLFINREVFESIGGFDESLHTAEDKDLTMRVVAAGYRALSIPGMEVIHLGYERNLWEFVRKEFWRQSHTLQLACGCGWSLRSLRNPLLSAWHMGFLVATIFSLAASWPVAFKFSLALWLLPGVLSVALRVGVNRDPVLFLQLILLNFLRWNAAGIALISQISKGGRPRLRG